jgi:hypothetical protein
LRPKALLFCNFGNKHSGFRIDKESATNQMTFSSRSLDLRFLGGFAKSITKDDIRVAHAGGKPAEATVLLVGFGADPINALHVDRRVVLNNGFHRVFALRSVGVTKIPIVLQEVVNADIEFPDSLLGLSRAYLLQYCPACRDQRLL